MEKSINEQQPTQPVTGVVVAYPLMETSADEKQPSGMVQTMQLLAAQHSCDITALMDMAGAILYISPSVEKLTGWAPWQLRKRIYIDAIHPEDCSRTFQSFSSCTCGETGAGCECRFRCASGDYIWMESRLDAIRFPDNVPAYIVATMRDITIQKNLELELLRSEEHYRSLIENCPGGIAVIRDGKFFFVNRTGLKILGYENPAELLDKNFETIIEPLHQKEVLEVHDKMMNGVKMYGSREIPVIRNDGMPIYLSVDIAFVSNFKGPSIVCYYRDITEIKRDEEALRQNLEQLKLIIQGSRDIFFDWDIESGHMERGSSYAEILGYAPGELAPHLDVWKNLLHPEDKEHSIQSLQDHLGGKTDFYESEHRLRHKSGDYIWIEARGMVTARDDNGKPLQMSGSLLDVTRRKTLEREIASTHEELERLVAARTDELKETNTALMVLLKQRENEKNELESAVETNIRSKLYRHIDKLRSFNLNDDQIAILDMFDKDIRGIMSSFNSNMKMYFPSLSPRETQILERVQQGKKSKDIALEFNISIRTVNLLRYRIRKKLNINGKKVNLESVMSMQP
jgi:PAS domain S-box-containing protein